MSRIYDQTILDGIISKVLKSSEELERTIAEGPLDKVSIQDAAEALAAQTEPIDVDFRPTLWTHRVWRGDRLLHTAMYQARNADEARADGRHYYAWDRVSKVELVHPNGTVEEIR